MPVLWMPLFLMGGVAGGQLEDNSAFLVSGSETAVIGIQGEIGFKCRLFSLIE